MRFTAPLAAIALAFSAVQAMPAGGVTGPVSGTVAKLTSEGGALNTVDVCGLVNSVLNLVNGLVTSPTLAPILPALGLPELLAKVDATVGGVCAGVSDIVAELSQLIDQGPNAGEAGEEKTATKAQDDKGKQ